MPIDDEETSAAQLKKEFNKQIVNDQLSFINEKLKMKTWQYENTEKTKELEAEE